MIEQVLKEMKRLLETKLPQELEKQEGAAGDGIVLGPVNTILIGDQTYQATGLPAIILQPISAEDALWATGKKDVSYRVAIGVATTDTDEDRSQVKLWRTIRAVENVFEIYAPGSVPIINYQTIGIDYKVSLFEIDEDKSTEKGGVLSALVVERLDSYTSTQI